MVIPQTSNNIHVKHNNREFGLMIRITQSPSHFINLLGCLVVHCFNNAASKSTSSIPSLERFFIATFSKIISACMDHKSTSHRVTYIVGIQWDVAVIYLVRSIAIFICQYVSKVSCMANFIFWCTMGMLQNCIVISSVIVSKKTIQYMKRESTITSTRNTDSGDWNLTDRTLVTVTREM